MSLQLNKVLNEMTRTRAFWWCFYLYVVKYNSCSSQIKFNMNNSRGYENNTYFALLVEKYKLTSINSKCWKNTQIMFSIPFTLVLLKGRIKSIQETWSFECKDLGNWWKNCLAIIVEGTEWATSSDKGNYVE